MLPSGSHATESSMKHLLDVVLCIVCAVEKGIFCRFADRSSSSGRNREVLIWGSTFKESLRPLAVDIEATSVLPLASSWSMIGFTTFIIRNHEGSNFFCHSSRSLIALSTQSLIQMYLNLFSLTTLSWFPDCFPSIFFLTLSNWKMAACSLLTST